MKEKDSAYPGDFIRIHSLQTSGVDCTPVTIEALRSRGLQQLTLTGLPDAWLRESRDKIRALVGRYCKWGPMERVLIHLLPADQIKNGAHLELPIVLSCIAVLGEKAPSAEMRATLERFRFVGALSLEGWIEETGLSTNLHNADPERCLGPEHFRHLSEVIEFVAAGAVKAPPRRSPVSQLRPQSTPLDKTEGRYWERFWLAAAAVADTPVLMVGFPGTGKSHLARWAHRLLPAPSAEVLSQQQRIWSLSAMERNTTNPHLMPHSRTHLSEFIGVSRFGVARPGIFSLAHGGLLQLDEFSELNRDCRETLRTVLDQKRILSNTKASALSWPADFWLIATSNPCACGFLRGDDPSRCLGDVKTRFNYRARISGPMLDRFGLRLFMSDDSKHEASFHLVERELLDGGAEPGARVAEARLAMPGFLSEAEARVARNPLFTGYSLRARRNKARLLAAAAALSGKALEVVDMETAAIATSENVVLGGRRPC